MAPTTGPLFQVNRNQLTSLPPELGLLVNLKQLSVGHNQLTLLPAEIGKLTRLETLGVDHNQLKWLPPELSQLPKLTHLDLRGNQLPTIAGLPFALTDDSGKQCARRVHEIIAASTHIGTIRKHATEICVGLQDLELPAFVTLQIIDEAVHENSIRMWAKWELITTVKHYRERCGALRGARRAPTIKDEGEDLVLIESENHRYENPCMYPSDERLHWAKRED